ncbi:MAG: hypothetical protein MR412_00820 [Firmicutes bacterium]|nr:hypothetical protein [Bacillota bacterium]MDY5676255.1 hypothetical protein [Eubacteriales bacterium]
MDLKYQKYYDEFIKINGVEKEIILCIEEMSELTKALSKFLRYKGSEKENTIKDNIVEEIADVLNTCEQMQNIFGVDKVNAVREQKFKRYFEKSDK